MIFSFPGCEAVGAQFGIVKQRTNVSATSPAQYMLSILYTSEFTLLLLFWSGDYIDALSVEGNDET